MCAETMLPQESKKPASQLEQNLGKLQSWLFERKNLTSTIGIKETIYKRTSEFARSDARTKNLYLNRENAASLANFINREQGLAMIASVSAKPDARTGYYVVTLTKAGAVLNSRPSKPAITSELAPAKAAAAEKKAAQAPVLQKRPAAPAVKEVRDEATASLFAGKNDREFFYAMDGRLKRTLGRQDAEWYSSLGAQDKYLFTLHAWSRIADAEMKKYDYRKDRALDFIQYNTRRYPAIGGAIDRVFAESKADMRRVQAAKANADYLFSAAPGLKAFLGPGYEIARTATVQQFSELEFASGKLAAVAEFFRNPQTLLYMNEVAGKMKESKGAANSPSQKVSDSEVSRIVFRTFLNKALFEMPAESMFSIMLQEGSRFEADRVSQTKSRGIMQMNSNSWLAQGHQQDAASAINRTLGGAGVKFVRQLGTWGMMGGLEQNINEGVKTMLGKMPVVRLKNGSRLTVEMLRALAESRDPQYQDSLRKLAYRYNGSATRERYSRDVFNTLTTHRFKGAEVPWFGAIPKYY